jgi:hypothetical protein
VQELFDEYVEYCKKEQRSSYKKIEFGSKLKELGIEYYKTAGNNKYKVSTEFLHELATTRHWVHEIDDYCEEQPTKEEQGSTQDDELIQKYTQSEKELKELKNENEQMRLELESLKQAKKEQTIVRVIEDSDNEDENPAQLQIEHDKLKKEFEALKKKFDSMQAPTPAPVKSILSMIDNSSDDEGNESEKEENDVVRLKDNKILRALGCDNECDFID